MFGKNTFGTVSYISYNIELHKLTLIKYQDKNKYHGNMS